MPPSTGVLSELKALRHERSERSPFGSHTDFLRWTDRVEPLLQFSQTLTNEFKGSVHSAKMLLDWKDDKYGLAVNGAIGAVNKAITLLELQLASTPPSMSPPSPTALPVVVSAPPALTLPDPPKVTIKWLYEHVPVKLYVAATSIMAVVFFAGIAFADSGLYSSLKGVFLRATERPTNAISSKGSPPVVNAPFHASSPK